MRLVLVSLNETKMRLKLILVKQRCLTSKGDFAVCSLRIIWVEHSSWVLYNKRFDWSEIRTGRGPSIKTATLSNYPAVLLLSM